MPTPENHYYLVISDQHRSFIKKAKSPVAAACWYSESDEGVWHIRKGIADFHYIGYQFLTNGTIKDKPLDIVDLGPVASHSAPLLRHRVPEGLENPALQSMLRA